MATDQELKISRMTKRSSNKKLFSRATYKLREFVLTPCFIKYFDVSGGNRGKEKGRISLSNVKYVEKVQDEELDGNKNVLQLGFVEDAAADAWFLMYVIASSSMERDDWISLIRFYSGERGANFLPRYHPGVWRRPGRYSCCDDINRRSLGCQATTESIGVIQQLQSSVEPSRRTSLSHQSTVTTTDLQTQQQPVSPASLGTVPVTSTMSVATFASVPSSAAPPAMAAALLQQQQQLLPMQQTPPLLSPLQLQQVGVTGLQTASTMTNPHHQQQQQLPGAKLLVNPTPASTVFSPTLQQQQNAAVAAVFMQQQQQQQQRQQKMTMFPAQLPTTASHMQQCVGPSVTAATPRDSGGARRHGSARFNNPLQPLEFDDSENTVIAVHNYNPVRENQLPLQKGEKYFVVNQSNAQWWYVRNMAGQAGYVPTNYIHKPNSLNSFDWYYKDITRQQAEAILLEESREGCFLVRDSVSKKNTFTLSVTSKDPEDPGKLKVHHYHIHRTEGSSLSLPNGHSNGFTNGIGGGPANGNSTSNSAGGGGGGAGGEAQFYLSEKHAFPTISDVIHYHKHNSGGLVVRLRSPPVKDRESPVTAGMGLDEFELDPAELQIDRDPIGKGQFGVVKRGKFRNIPVAVKQMVEGAMNEDDFIEEAKNMRFLNHPNLVQLFGVVLKKRPIMIITEYMRYGSLRDFLRQRQSQFCNRPVMLADICAQVGNGMAYLEREQFVHRDLAARNCLVKSVSRNSIVVKVADFGMARFLLDNVYEPSAGTKFPVRWAAPEVFQSIYTDKADVWSFGVLMWEVFTYCLENPYHGMNNAQVYQFIVGGGRLHKPAICPDRLYVLMLECWQHDRNKRPAFEYICQKIGDYLDQNCEN